jgi:hypothetical protein
MMLMARTTAMAPSTIPISHASLPARTDALLPSLAWVLLHHWQVVVTSDVARIFL